jgi:NAD(P)-dependent dehydrogenase (short-subunit alcohol dehydrogenase family)
VAQAEDALGPVDTIVTCAGIVHDNGSVTATSTDAFTQTMDVNFLGSVNAVKAVLPWMLEGGRGRAVLVASNAAVMRTNPAVHITNA